MDDLHRLRTILADQPAPPCVELTPFEIVAANFADGYVRLHFAEQPAFGNHFGHVQGGFAVAMIDVLVSLAAYAKVQEWLPTVEIKASFLAPAKIGGCIGEGRVMHAGRSVMFLEGRLWSPDGLLAVHATATAAIKAS